MNVRTCSEVPVQIGLREASQRLSKAIKAVKAGEEVILTERGKPIAVIRPVAELGGLDARLRQLEAAGILRRAARPGPMKPWTPPRVKGVSLSAAIREDRDAR